MSRVTKPSKKKLGVTKKQIDLELATRAVELVMLVSTLFWAFEVNAGDSGDKSHPSLTDQSLRAPASSGRSVRPAWQTLLLNPKLSRRLLPPNWLTLANDTIPSPELGISKSFNDFLSERMKTQASLDVFTGTSLSPSFKQDPLYVPTSATLFRFRSN